MKPVDVTTEILIGRPVSEVAGYASDPDNAIQWYANIKSVKWLPDEQSGKIPKPFRVGSKIAFTAQFLGKRLLYTYEIVEFIPNEKFVMRTADGPFPMETTYCWEGISERETRMTLRNRGTPSGFSAVFAPFMALAMKKENLKDVRRLKDILEGNSRNAK